MASLRTEASNVHAGLFGPSAAARLPPILVHPRAPTHPHWPFRAISALSIGLCNNSLPLSPPPTLARIDASGTSTLPDDPKALRVCPEEVPDKEGCTAQSLVQRLWKITTYADRAMRDSPAYRQYATLSSFSILRGIRTDLEAGVSKSKTPPVGPQQAPWLHIYNSQPDSISLLLLALKVPFSESSNRAAGRFAIQLYSTPNQWKHRVSFLLDGVDITAQMPFCPSISGAVTANDKNSGSYPDCPVERFFAFLRRDFFLPPGLSAPPHVPVPSDEEKEEAEESASHSDEVFRSICASSDTRGLLTKPVIKEKVGAGV